MFVSDQRGKMLVSGNGNATRNVRTYNAFTCLSNSWRNAVWALAIRAFFSFACVCFLRWPWLSVSYADPLFDPNEHQTLRINSFARPHGSSFEHLQCLQAALLVIQFQNIDKSTEGWTSARSVTKWKIRWFWKMTNGNLDRNVAGRDLAYWGRCLANRLNLKKHRNFIQRSETYDDKTTNGDLASSHSDLGRFQVNPQANCSHSPDFRQRLSLFGRFFLSA